MKNNNNNNDAGLTFVKIESNDNFPATVSRPYIVRFLYSTMQPYNDQIPDIEKALDYAFPADGSAPQGFVMLVLREKSLLGVLVMLQTGMSGFIPENVLLFVSVVPEARGQGIGKMLIEHSIKHCQGDVKLHVEYENPAKRLYERLGFTSKYAEMRYVNR